MEKNSTPDSFLKQLEALQQKEVIPAKHLAILRHFYLAYAKALNAHHIPISQYERLFSTYMQLIAEQCREPFVFDLYHRRIRSPFDHYRFGLDLFKPLVDKSTSSVNGLADLKEIVSCLQKGENAIFFANHQIESDPQAINILLEEHFPSFAENLIFVAGERVITDPLAVPLSMGCNLLCIYSKRYIDQPPEHKSKKQLHNKRTMQLMSELLSEGGKAIYVAPSGGRDRPNAEGIVTVAPFDPQSIEMFYLMALRAGHPTRFYPLVLKTHALLPPPETIQVELGEARLAKRSGIHLAFGPAFDIEHFSGSELSDKHARREARAQAIWETISTMYQKFP